MLIFAIGFVSQILFFLRTVIQWILSERSRKVISPSIYWILSLIASYLFFIYGWLRNDFAILLGQTITYFIYIWNIRKLGVWVKLPVSLKPVLLLTPFVAVLFVVRQGDFFIDKFFSDQSIPLWLIIYGSVGQIVFTFRFIYQLFYSIRNDESLLPQGFWIISLIGSMIILTYGIFRLDPILILGQSLSMVAYIRNVMIHQKSQIRT
jgi:lipid-A-disaccharide synthase-like uncharacterized protein